MNYELFSTWQKQPVFKQKRTTSSIATTKHNELDNAEIFVGSMNNNKGKSERANSNDDDYRRWNKLRQLIFPCRRFRCLLSTWDCLITMMPTTASCLAPWEIKMVRFPSRITRQRMQDSINIASKFSVLIK